MFINDYKFCTRCVMNSSIPEILFDKNGVCNFCTEFLERSQKYIFHKNLFERDKNLLNFVKRMKLEGRGKRYDCLVGISGGVDSSWVLVKAVELGLRPLAVHMDNGWNSELAQNNIENLVKKLGVDLVTHVIDWQEYRQLMQCFFEANVVDVELLYDNAMLAVNYQQAQRFNINTILAGTNQSTEGMQFPIGWNHHKFDKKNIYSIAKNFGPVRIKTFPSIGTFGFIYQSFIKKRKWVSFLDMISFNKQQALDSLERSYGYKKYPYKHYESVFTRFYQGYILIEKFGIDKRIIHLSNLIVSKQIKRTEALSLLSQSAYSNTLELKKDKKNFLKKMLWTEDDLCNYLLAPRVEHSFYGSEVDLYNKLKKFYFKFICNKRSIGVIR